MDAAVLGRVSRTPGRLGTLLLLLLPQLLPLPLLGAMQMAFLVSFTPTSLPVCSIASSRQTKLGSSPALHWHW